MLRASAGSILFTPVYECTSPSAPYAYLIEIDGVRILFDCGWNDAFDPMYLTQLKPHLASVHAVLISSPHINACGALPFVLEHIAPGTLVAAAGATSKIAVHSVLHPFLYQYPNSHTFALDDGSHFNMTVDSIYNSFRMIREPYGGKVTIKHDDMEVSCFAVFAGRMLGGYGWTIKYQIDELFYCPDFSVKPSYALKRFNMPTTANIMFLCSFPFHLSGASSTKKYEEQLQALFKEMQHTLRGGSDVLVPVDVAGRGLEVLNTIIHLLAEQGGDKYKVAMVASQAQELIDKAATMTESLQDDLILGDQRLFANVVACRSAEEVMALPSPKICVADGAALDFGPSAELLEYFVKGNRDGADHLIVFVEPPLPGTNAAAIAAAEDGERLDVHITRRSRLNGEELEEYYIELEHDMEQRRRELEAQSAFNVVQDDDAAGAREADDEEDETDVNARGDAVGNTPAPAASASGTSTGATTGGKLPTSAQGAALQPKSKPAAVSATTVGLVLPSPLHYFSRHLCFPVLETTGTLSAAALKHVDVAYGLPVSDEEQLVLQKRAPTRLQSDAGPEALLVENDAQRLANIPSKISQVAVQVNRRCRVVLSDLTGYPDALTMKSILKTKWTFAKKMVGLRGGADDGRAFLHFCRAEKAMKCGSSVFTPSVPRTALELATHVYSYAVQLEASLASNLVRGLRPVRESKSDSTWEVGWVDGELSGVLTEADFNEPAAQRSRLELSSYSLTTVAPEKTQACATQRELKGLQSGSFFVGDVDLQRLRESSRLDNGLYSEFHKKAPLLVFDEGVCVRKGGDGTVTISSIATPALFDLRRAVYRQYSQTL
ncbi:putative cleavage and polyadenylation specificity factor [Leptomonas pyrrhocoris]|uniref:Cleavage and polyadenylation specificity factor subunit 2 n=1 Tax=Leptomonas pyrrhocoris TaxID=157538 RepID=A0A0N0DV19_LEPPY|nr:putative cleavage and polyadenylation specificity factor [Leptomonas pyrrhocoris]XP_015657843.1 putative cleavage and polyadenylation specificity factor [Leptomonas pyrrhocoris]KPA79403.1 putative cleavage and polyadenylation specificity factor [Leptomonas pyrrhocoris]KPA79404.1 putative cleavage and polyadenylation specificity factor [Leptomonas pyrrhocoris]|eukprot:XP_015657842.1 putative cleavage and polyadenylation specificity factor [Leptomonas pyrrhocoris]